MIKKRIGQRDELNKFTTHKLKIVDDVASPLRNLLQATLKPFVEKPTIKTFSDPSAISEDLMMIPKTSLKALAGLLSDLELHQDGSPIESLKQMNNARTYCFEIQFDNERVFAFSDVSHLYIPDEPNTISTHGR